MDRLETTKEERAPDRDDANIQRFFDRFAGALTEGDIEAIGEMWTTPAFVLGADTAQALSSPEDVDQLFDQAKEQYNGRGITDTRADIDRIEWLTDHIALVTVRWPYLNEVGEENGEERSTYVVMRNDDGSLELRAAIMQGESKVH